MMHSGCILGSGLILLKATTPTLPLLQAAFELKQADQMPGQKSMVELVPALWRLAAAIR
jgi:hypothetical protein